MKLNGELLCILEDVTIFTIHVNKNKIIIYILQFIFFINGIL